MMAVGQCLRSSVPGPQQELAASADSRWSGHSNGLLSINITYHGCMADTACYHSTKSWFLIREKPRTCKRLSMRVGIEDQHPETSGGAGRSDLSSKHVP